MEHPTVPGVEADQLEKIEIPGLGGFLHLMMRLVTVLPWFIARRRTLDAWVLENRRTVMQSWVNEADGANREVYIPLPIRKGDPRSGVQILQPGANDIRTTIAAPRATVQIIGPGGAGKTTLARQIGQWGFENGPQSGIAAHPMMPIWVDEELDPAKNSLRDVLKGKLIAALPNEEIDDVLFAALLQKQRLLVFADRLSERSVTTQRHVETIYRSTKIGLLVVTSRTPHRIDGAQTVNIYPQPLNSATLLRFMTDLLPFFLSEGDDSKPFSTIEVYLRQLRLINPQDANLPHFVPDDRMVKAAKTLAKIALGGDLIPKEFNRSEAAAALQATGESITVGCDPIKRLALNGVLIEKPGGMDVRLRFALDPIAEFLAAVAYGEQCGPDAEKWEILMMESQAAPGFQGAIKLVRQAYWSLRTPPNGS